MLEQIKNFNFKKNGIKVILIILGVILYSLGLKWFIYPSNILPSGFTGTSVLLQRVFERNFNITIPITVLNVGFNIIPTIIAFKYLGKRFTIISFMILFSFSLIADYIPVIKLTKDPLVAAIFGGLLCGFGASLFFRCGVSSAGFDFIAMTISTKFHVQAFGYVLMYNICLIIVQGILFGWQYSFYSIICQFVCTQAINTSYRHFEAITIFIISNRADEIADALIKNTKHSSTKFDGIGCYTKNAKSMLYMVVTQPEVRYITQIAKDCDPESFINIVQSKQIQGNFNYLSVDKDEIDMNF